MDMDGTVGHPDRDRPLPDCRVADNLRPLPAIGDRSTRVGGLVSQELDLISSYLAIEQVRFADRLTVSIDVPASLRAVGVPPFLLQPLVENAVKHAVAPVNGPRAIAIRGQRTNTSVRIEISDSGPG